MIRYYNPWVDTSVSRCFPRFLTSSSLKAVIDSRVQYRFAKLWKEQVRSSKEFQDLVSNLKTEVDRGIEKIDREVETRVNDIISENVDLQAEVAAKLERKIEEQYEKEVRELSDKVSTLKWTTLLLGGLTVSLFFVSR